MILKEEGGLPFTKKSGNFGWNVNGKPIYVFPNGVSKRKMCVPFAYLYLFQLFKLTSHGYSFCMHDLLGCPCKWNTRVPRKFPFGVLMRSIYCNRLPTGFSPPVPRLSSTSSNSPPCCAFKMTAFKRAFVRQKNAYSAGYPL